MNRGTIFMIVMGLIIAVLLILALIGYLSGRWENMDSGYGTASIFCRSNVLLCSG